MLTIPEISQFFAEITAATAIPNQEPDPRHLLLKNAGKNTEVSMALAIALQYPIKNGTA